VLDPPRDFNLVILQRRQRAEAIDTALSTPMFAESHGGGPRRTDAKKDARSVLERYLRQPAADLVLLLIDAAARRDDRRWPMRLSSLISFP
jgi:hypothetical protein